MFRRKIYSKLARWKNEQRGSSALLIEGQRRVGKSTVVEEFARREYRSYIRLDFSRCSRETHDLFNDVSDLDYIFLQLQLQSSVQLFPRESVIIFDEVQLCPRARQAIKALVHDHRYDYIETGSLISIRKNVKDILIPSEEYRLYMHPMDFEEFLWAFDDEATVPLLRQMYEKKRAVGSAAHRKLMRTFRLYMLIGGMPQAVAAYLSAKNFVDVDRIKRAIVELYEADFHKIDGTGRLSRLFADIPTQLHRRASRYSMAGALGRNRTQGGARLIAELVDSRAVLAAYHVNEPNAGLSLSKDPGRFKLYLSDTGLFTTLAFRDQEFTDNIIYQKLLSDRLPANLGYLYENIVAQTLAANGRQLYYHTFPNEKKTNLYEIDFLVPRKNKICPLEVKSSSYKRHASLDAFSERYSQHIDEKYLIYTKDLQREHDVLCLPVYMAQFL